MHIVSVERQRVGPLFNKNTQWAVDLKCPQCERKHGFAVAGLSHAKPGPLTNILAAIALKVIPSRNLPHRRYLRQLRTRDHRTNVEELAKATGFPILVLTGEPLELRGMVNGWGARRDLIRSVTMTYTAGPREHITRVLAIAQGVAEGTTLMAEADALNHASTPTPTNEALRLIMRDATSDYGLGLLKDTPRSPVAAVVDGVGVELSVASWDEDGVLLATAQVGDRYVVTASHGIAQEEVVGLLAALVRLQDSPAAIAELQERHDAMQRLRRPG